MSLVFQQHQTYILKAKIVLKQYAPAQQWTTILQAFLQAKAIDMINTRNAPRYDYDKRITCA